MSTWAHSITAKALRSCAALALFCVFATPEMAAAQTSGVVTATNLYVRNAASKEADAVCSIKNGTKVTVLSQQGDWYKIKIGSTTGYAAGQYISTSGAQEDTARQANASAPQSSTGTIKDLGSAPATCKPGERSDSVLKLQKALEIKGFYDGRLSGHYGELTEKAVKQFQKSKGLTQDGIAGKATIQALFGMEAADAGESSKHYATEALDWFNGGNGKIPNGAKFTVKDVQTGKTFKAKRRYGSNHLDAEPLKTTDSETIKSIYGGKWSWRRRPILVLYKEHVYAASMNGMPHGENDQKIKDNGFDGVFCIHFSGSKTHESHKVDSEHQNCVEKALKAQW